MRTTWITRSLESQLNKHFNRGKSVLLLGPRQTGKTSLLERMRWDLRLSFLLQRTRIDFEKNPDRLIDEVEAMVGKRRPRVLIDEVQKVPAIMDTVQYLSDKKKAVFALTGSSARKLKTSQRINLLPGRVVSLRLDPLTLVELPAVTLEKLLLYGSLPGIVQDRNREHQELDLESYAATFLEEEVRREALVRNVPAFARFIEMAAIDSGRISNMSAISKQVGVAHTTIAQHYQILEDCLIAERFDPLTSSATRRKLTRSSKYLFFDLGVRRLAANEGARLTPDRMGELFEQFVGLELRRLARLQGRSEWEVNFWRDPDGPEVDWVLRGHRRWIPIEVKWTTSPSQRDARHIEVFINEHPRLASSGVVVCRCERPIQLSKRVRAIPWKDLPSLVS